MAKLKEVQDVLENMLETEKKAEANCDVLLTMLHENGYSEMVEEIKNDEIHHQKMVQDLIDLLG